jgi:hypothetical protein
MKFRAITPDVSQRAAEAMAVSSTTRGRDPDFLALVAAGAALSLERAVPRLASDNYDLKAEDYLEERGSLAFRQFHSSLSRLADSIEQKEESNWDLGKGVKTVVAQVLQQASASRIIESFDTSLAVDLNEAQQGLADRARSDTVFYDDLALIAAGKFEHLSPETGESLAIAISGNLEGRIADEVERSSGAISQVQLRDSRFEEELSFSERELGSFSRIGDDDLKAVIDFHSKGASTGKYDLDEAMLLLADQGLVREKASVRDPIIISQARMLSGDDRMRDGSNPADIAAMIVSDSRIMEAASRIKDPTREDICRASGRYDKLDPVEREDIDREISLSSRTTYLERIRFHVRMSEREEAKSHDLERKRNAMMAASQASGLGLI